MIKEKLGFTLMELMAVVIIISILAVLGAGYYRKSVEQMRFTEILSNTNAVAEAVNRYIVEKQAEGVSLENIKPKFSDLDISFASSCGNQGTNCSIKGRYDIIISRNKVEAQPIKGIYANHISDGGYYISVQTHFGNPKDEVACLAGTVSDPGQKGQSFCESMGFTQCAGSGPVKCTKPLR